MNFWKVGTFLAHPLHVFLRMSNRFVFVSFVLQNTPLLVLSIMNEGWLWTHCLPCTHPSHHIVCFFRCVLLRVLGFTLMLFVKGTLSWLWLESCDVGINNKRPCLWITTKSLCFWIRLTTPVPVSASFVELDAATSLQRLSVYQGAQLRHVISLLMDHTFFRE